MLRAPSGTAPDSHSTDGHCAGVQIEEPAAVLALDAMCKSIQTAVDTIIHCEQGERVTLLRPA